MGALKHRGSGQRVTLAMRSLVGRTEGCVVRLENRRVSGEHAVLFWDGGRWWLRDLGSTNGTFIDDRRIAVGERVPMEAGAAVSFGGNEERWELNDAGPPVASARAEATGEVRPAVDGLLPLPEATDPQVTLFEDRHGLWRVEADGQVRPAVDQERIKAGELWVLSVPPAAETGAVPTTHRLEGDPKVVSGMTLRFEVSRDREHIALSIVHGGAVTSLGGRAFHEVLLVLAEARLCDKAADLPAAEQGWLYVDDLLTSLKINLQHFNMNVFRARQHLARAGVLDAGAIVERRPLSRQIRLGTGAIEIRIP